MQTAEARQQRVEAKKILKGAVQQNGLSNKRGILEKIFRVWFDGMVYNQIWEDPIVDAEALQMGPKSKILTISSGGCNLLNYLVNDPQKINAVDLNPNHMNLARLRIAAVKHLPNYESLLQFFGAARGKENIELYTRYIKPHLTEDEQKYWEKVSALRPVTPKRIHYFSRNLYNYSRSGYFIRFLHVICKAAKCDTTQILKAKNLEEQRELFEKHLAPTFDHWIVRSFGKLPVMLYSLGIPPQQFEALLQDEESIVELYRNRVRRLACNFPINENYFAWQAFARKYDVDNQSALPPYLQEKNYEAVKGRVDRIETQITTTTEFISNSAPGSLNCFIFLDSQDWMNQQQITDQWQAVARAGEPNSRIIFRTAGKESPIERMLPAELMQRFTYHGDLSKELYERDRSAVYGGFHIYELNS
ncbi:MAG: BtaA family protein [Bdellovibrionales bacterium]|nr:BtaA family protein [Bdellovibrionales bacterium]